MTKRMRSLDTRGFSRTSFEGLRPLPEKPEAPLPHTKTSSKDYLFSPEESDQLSSSTPSSPTTTGRSSNGFGDSNTWSVGTGNITGRSSVYSWGNDDEFDQQASATVHKLFQEIDQSLFEHHQASRTSDLKEECSDWSNTFPHLRVLGNQLFQSTESGTQLVQTEGDRLMSANNLLEDVDIDSQLPEVNSLTVNGYRVEAVPPPNAVRSYSKADDASSVASLSLSHLEEEVFEMDGEVEEIIAYDSNSIDSRDSVRDRQHRRKYKHGAYPPVTPNAFIQDTVISECFDQLWQEIISVLRDLLKLYEERIRKEEDRMASTRYYGHTPRILDSALGIHLPVSRDGYSRVPPLPSQHRLKTAGSYTTSSDVNGLNELMTIRSVALQQRAPSVNTNLLRDEDPPPTAPSKDHFSIHGSRPVSSNVTGSRAVPRMIPYRNADVHIYDRIASAKTPKRNIRLQPLQLLDRSKTPGTSELDAVGEVRGTRLQTAGDRISPHNIAIITPQPWGARNGMLPPLDRVGTADALISLRERNKSPKRSANRAASAATDELRNPSTRERLHSTLPDSRPNTTHTFHVEASINPAFIPSRSRLSTPQTQSLQKLRDTLHGPSGRSVLHGIHSVQQTINENFDPHYHSSNKSVTFGGDVEEFDDFVLWGHGPPMISHQPRRGKTAGSNIR